LSVKDDYYIDIIDRDIAQEIVKKYHYLHRQAPCEKAFGLFSKQDIPEKNKLTTKMNLFYNYSNIVGVVMYGTPPSSPLRRGICGDDEKDNVIELTRLWTRDNLPKNTESFLVGNTIKQIDKEIIVSYADTSEGHIGYIYQATNWIYTGLSAKRKDWKINGLDIHGHTIADKYTAEQLRKKYGDDFYSEDRPRKHRYIYFNCNKKRKKELIEKLNYPILEYPKG